MFQRPPGDEAVFERREDAWSAVRSQLATGLNAELRQAGLGYGKL